MEGVATQSVPSQSEFDLDFDFEEAKATAHSVAEVPCPDFVVSASELCSMAIGIGIDVMEGKAGTTRWMMTVVGCHLSKIQFE